MSTITTIGGKCSLLCLALAAAVLVGGVLTLATLAEPAEAATGKAKIVFASDRTTGKGVDNPEGDLEIFSMNPDRTGLKQLTKNAMVSDAQPVLSSDGKKIVYTSFGEQASNPEGDQEVFSMDAADGKNQKNLTNNAAGINDFAPDYSPDSKKIAYTSSGGPQTSNPEGDQEVYRMDAADGKNKKNLTNTGFEVIDNDISRPVNDRDPSWEKPRSR
jgi:Tol biopolymer transport system component